MKRARYSSLKTFAILIVIFLIALLLRLYNINWDNGFYLNPDERFLAMVASGLRLPQSLGEYFNQSTSQLNPYNTGNSFFVYGHFPLTLAKVLAVLFGFDEYGRFFRLARPLSAVADASVILALYFFARRLFRQIKQAKTVAMLSALVYAMLVFPIQQAHFFTTDSLVNAFFVWSLCFALYSPQGTRYLVFSAVFYGLGQASKISMVYSLPLILGVITLNNYRRLSQLLGYFVCFGIISYLTLRVSDPYIFKSANFLDPRLAKLFLDNLAQLRSYSVGTAFPPSVQWQNTGFFFALKNLFFFGTGGLFYILAVFGYLYSLKKRLSLGFLLLLGVWVVGFYSYLSLQLAKTMRYYIFLYPFVALYAGLALSLLKKFPRVSLFLLAIVWTAGFMRVYNLPHSRIQATDWINQTVAPQSTIVWEYWDDPLPLYQQLGRNLHLLTINFYEPDTEKKWRLIAKKLQFADYLVLSSNRQSGSIGKAPDLYPLGAKYYQLLQQEKLGFKEVATFAVYPGIELGKLRVEFADQWAEEAFTVYDHPLVRIYRRTPRYSRQRFLKSLGVN